MRVAAYLYDGHSAAQYLVHFRIDAQGLLVIEYADGEEVVGPASALRVSSRVAHTRRTLWLPDGRQLQTDHNDAVDRLFPPQSVLEALVHLLEQRWPIALVSVVVIVLSVILLYRVAIPWAADRAAEAIPMEWEAQAGAHTLAALASLGFEPSELPPERQQALQASFERFVSELPEQRNYRLLLRDWEAPNAFALPGGSVVFTDDLVLLLDSDEEFLAVLAHEIGHLEHRHVLRSVLRSSTVAVLTAILFGDVGGASSLIIAVPSALVYSSYSREFERDADAYAHAALRRRGLSPEAFASAMRKLSQASGANVDDWSYLSSHPAAAERIEAAERAAR